MTAAIVSESTNVGYQVESVEGLESQPTEVAGSVTTHPQLLPEGGHSAVGGHGSFGSVSSSSMGVTLGYPSGHPDPYSSMIASAVESQSTAGSAATGTSTVTASTSDSSSSYRAAAAHRHRDGCRHESYTGRPSG